MPRSDVVEHGFTSTIRQVLLGYFGEDADQVLAESPLLGYLNIKTRAANRGSKARGSFANHYALYVVVEDYIARGYADGESPDEYSKYEGAKFMDLFLRQRQLPFGSKLQNHALNSRLNDEFKKYYSTVGKLPIVRDVDTRRYWVQEDLLLVTVRRSDGNDCTYNIARPVIDIIDVYVATRKAAFETFLDTCKQIAGLGRQDSTQAVDFVRAQLQPSVDARVFEIVSYAVLKANYSLQSVWIGDDREAVEEVFLVLYKTGRTNANDGGIDFVMKPLGRFFQVTETLDVAKYFLDIDKVQRFPITFVVKSDTSTEDIRAAIRAQAVARYKIEAVVESYMAAVEEVINVAMLLEQFREVVESGRLQQVMDEIVIQSMVEFNYEEDDEPGDLDAGEEFADD